MSEAGVIGREIPYALLSEVAPLNASDLSDAPARLVQSELVFARGVPPEAIYTFKHALVQDTAYNSLLRGRRADLHTMTAETLARNFPEILAHHYTEAGLTDTAVGYWKRAGELAAARFANVEPREHSTRAVDLPRSLTEGSGIYERELELLILLFGPTSAVKGLDHAGGERLFSRALELCEDIGDTPRFFPVPFGWCSPKFGLGQTTECLKPGRHFWIVLNAMRTTGYA